MGLGKKVVITTAVLSSAPFVLPPLVLFSTLGFMVSFPFGVAFMGYACTAKVMKLLLIRRPCLLAGEDDCRVNHIIERFEADKQTDGLLGETERETKREDGTKANLESASDNVIQPVKGNDKVIQDINAEEAERMADDRAVAEGRGEVFDERGPKESKTDEGMREEDIERENRREDGTSKDDIGTVDDKVFQSVKGSGEVIQEINVEEAEGMAYKRVVEEGRGEVFDERDPKESETDEGMREEDIERENRRKDGTNKDDIGTVDDKEFQSVKGSGEVIQEINVEEAEGMAYKRVVEEGREQVFEGPKESETVENRREEEMEKGPTDSEGKSLSQEAEIDKHMAGEVLPHDHPRTHDSEPVASPETADYPAPPASSFEDLTLASPEYSLTGEVPVEHVDETTNEEGRIWEEIESLRVIVGFKSPSQTSFMDELKALYIFTGVEPPSSFTESPDHRDVEEKLRYLKSVVGVK